MLAGFEVLHPSSGLRVEPDEEGIGASAGGRALGGAYGVVEGLGTVTGEPAHSGGLDLITGDLLFPSFARFGDDLDDAGFGESI